MPRFLIEVPHEKSKQSCVLAIEVFNKTGSHFLTNADWGCSDDVHKAWIIIEMDSKEEALMVVPPPFRDNATVVTLEKFTLETVDDTLRDQHED
jgi:hypothetical protein